MGRRSLTWTQIELRQAPKLVFTTPTWHVRITQVGEENHSKEEISKLCTYLEENFITKQIQS